MTNAASNRAEPIGFFSTPYPASVTVDVFVCGATMGGCFAAIAAVQSGKTVYIIEQHPYHIGGVETGGLSYQDTPSAPEALWPLCLDFYTRCAARYNLTIAQFMATSGFTRFCNGEPHVFLEVLNEMLAENGITVHCGQRVEHVIKSGLYITSVVTTDGTKVYAKRYIDSSYEGDLMVRSGCSYTFGREANSQYGETNNGATALADIVVGHPIDPYVTEGVASSGLLPNVLSTATTVGQGDKRIVGYNYRLCMTQAPNKIIPPDPDPDAYDAMDYEYLGRLFAATAITGLSSIFTSLPLQNGKFDWNANGAIGTNIFTETFAYPYNDYGARDAFWTRLKNYTLGLFKFIREDSRVNAATKAEVASYGFCADEFQRNGGMSPYVYVRESNRLVGDFVMTQPLINSPALLDIVGYGAYTLDSHYVSLVADSGTLKVEGKTTVSTGYYYPVPYRTLLPKQSECRNLLVTFCVSWTHITFSGERMEYVHMGVGEAAGYAAAISIDQLKDVCDLDVSFVQEAVELNPSGVVMDALAPVGNGTVTITGTWTTSINTVGKAVWGPNFINDGTTGKGTKTVKYTPTLPAAGSYEVWVKFRAVNDATRANNVPYTVQRSGGTSTGTFSQKVTGSGVNGFLSLGSFTFVGDGSDYLQIETTGTAAGTAVCADAVVFKPNFTLQPTLAAFQNGSIQTADVTVSSAQLLTLNATPVQLVAAPGTGYALVLLGALFTKAAGTAYAGIAAGEDLAIRYTNSSGAIVLEAEPTGFLDQATAQTLYAYPFVQGATSPVFSVAPVANSPLMLHMLVGEITTGTSDLKVRVWYRIVPTAL